MGSSQSIQTYLSQVELHTNDLLVLCGKFPKDWEADLLSERPSTSLEASYRKLTFTKGDLNAALIQPQNGRGIITILHAPVSVPSLSQPVPASVPQTVVLSQAPVTPIQAPQPEIAPAHVLEDVLIESPIDQRAELSEPQTTPYPAASSDEHQDVTETESPSITEEERDELVDFAAHRIRPSAYAIPPHSSVGGPTGSRPWMMSHTIVPTIPMRRMDQAGRWSRKDRAAP